MTERTEPTVSGTNFGKAASEYGAHRAGFPDSFFERLALFEVGLPGQSIIDLGTGTGTLARGFSRRGCSAIGVDIDARMLEKARELAREEGLDVPFVEGRAESTGLPSGTADVVVAGQCWHWFDRPQTIAEVRRLLKPGGRLVIAHFDWLPLSGNVVEATETLIEEHNPKWNLGGGLGLHPRWLPDLSAGGMQEIETFSYDVDVPYTPEAWRKRIQASAGVAALEAQAAQAFDGELRDLLAARFAGDVLAVPHRVFAIVCVKRE